MKKHPVWLCIILVLLVAGCGRIRRFSENEVVPVPAVEMLHQESGYKQTFNLRLSRRFRLKAIDEKGEPLKGETFLFSINPAAEPFSTAVTNAKGEINVAAELPTSVKEIYVRPHLTSVGGERLMKVADADEFIYKSGQKEIHTEKNIE